MRPPRVELTARLEGRALLSATYEGGGFSCVIGRADDCEFRIEEVGVSRRHCRVFERDGGVFVEDLHSANGTFISGQRIQRRVLLGTGDFSVCNVVISYRVLGLSKGPSRALVPAQGLADLTLQITPEKIRKQTRHKVVRPALRGHLVLREADGRTRVILLDKASYTLGSQEQSDLILPKASRCAALVARGDTAFEIVDTCLLYTSPSPRD